MEPNMLAYKRNGYFSVLIFKQIKN